jgi:hypothetical protein
VTAHRFGAVPRGSLGPVLAALGGTLAVPVIHRAGGSGSVLNAALLVPFLLAVLTGAAKTTTA